MFESEITLNRFLMGAFDSVVQDIPSDRIYERAPGNGHPPVWVLGHLAVCGQLGEKFCGGALTNPEWQSDFAPGSSDEIADEGKYSRAEFTDAIHESYVRFSELAQGVDRDRLQQPHGVELLDGSPISTVGDLVAHLFSSHFGFHLAQLSSWRRAAGFGPLF